MINIEAVFNISYGLYIVSSGDKKKGNGFVANTVFQVTSKPAKFATCCNKDNFTAEFIKRHEAFSIAILSQNASVDTIGRFGYKSGKDVDKMEGMNLKYGETGVPIVTNDCIAYLECKLVQTYDVGTHLMFIGELINAEIINEINEPLTYLYYRQVRKGVAPKNAPTYIDKPKIEIKTNSSSLYKKYKCPACGYIYDDEIETIKFKDLPTDWVCPICGSDKSDFYELN